MIRLTPQNFTVDAAAPDAPARRTVSGVAVVYGVEATVSDGTRVKFAKGSLPLDGPAPKIFMYHDSSQPVGILTERIEAENSVLFTGKISETTLGNEFLVLAQDGVVDQVSVGVNPLKFRYTKDGVMEILSADWFELSMVPHGAVAGAVINQIAASIPDAEDIHETETEVVFNEVENSQGENEMSESVETPAVIEASTIAPLFAQPKQAFKMPSAAEYISAFLQGGSVAAEMNAKIQAAAPDVNTLGGSLDGVLPLPIVQPVYNNFRGLRPLIDAVSPKAMPQGGKVFIRPKVTTHTSIGGPETESQTITDGTFVISDEQVTKRIFGGYVSVSEASIDWTQPEVLSLLLDDMARIYANQTDEYACQQFQAGVTQTATLADDTSAADWAAFVYEAATDILVNSNGNLPNALMVSPNYFQALGTLTDDAGRPLFPQVGPMNAFGSMNPGSVESSAFGLRLVVDRNLVNQVYVGNTDGFEVFEQAKGAISIDNVSQLSRTVAFRGYLATLMIDNTKFVKRA
jgi:HK97 family phage prohead protease/HK97 family phage major capsid protein